MDGDDHDDDENDDVLGVEDYYTSGNDAHDNAGCKNNDVDIVGSNRDNRDEGLN